MQEPTADQAHQFCLMLSSGMPPRDAIRYFFPDLRDSGLLNAQTDHWMSAPRTQAAQRAIMGKPWQSMQLRERIEYALDKHYTEAAYFLYTHNYADLGNAEKSKADTCRQILEAKLAGTAGQLNPLDQFYSDILASGKLKLAPKAN